MLYKPWKFHQNRFPHRYGLVEFPWNYPYTREKKYTKKEVKVLLVGFQFVRRWLPILAPVVRMQPPNRKGEVSVSPIILHEVFAPTVFEALSLRCYIWILFCIHQSVAHARTWLVIPWGLKNLVHFGHVYVLSWFRWSASVTLICCMPILLFTAIFLYSWTMFLMLLWIGLVCTGLLINSLHFSLTRVSFLQLWIWHLLRSSAILSSHLLFMPPFLGRFTLG